MTLCRLAWAVCLLPAVAPLSATARTAVESQARAKARATLRFASGARPLVLVDASNLRWRLGAASDRAARPDAAATSARVDAWARGFGVGAAIVWDHGAAPAAFRTARGNALVFAGPKPRQSADDVLAQLLAYAHAAAAPRAGAPAAAVVVTSDMRLVGRLHVQHAESAARDRLEMRACPAACFAALLRADAGEPAPGAAAPAPPPWRLRAREPMAARAADADALLARLVASSGEPLGGDPLGEPRCAGALAARPDDLAPLVDWYNGGCEGLAVQRTSKKGHRFFRLAPAVS